MGTLLALLGAALLSLGGCGIVWGCIAPKRRFWDWWDSDGQAVFLVFFLFIFAALVGPADARFWDGADY